MYNKSIIRVILITIFITVTACSSDQGAQEQVASQDVQTPMATPSEENTDMGMSMDNMQGMSDMSDMSGMTGMHETGAMPEADDVSQTRTSDNGLFQVSIEPAIDPLPLNQMHGWVLSLMDGSGSPVDNAEITVDGGMPAHNHGMPTVPQVTANLGDGRYQVEGVQFQMPGHWVVTFNIAANAQSDSVTYNLMLQP
ncbi:MAG: FixH family protein [Gammaproteobacteria bacterium]|nr:FixH family protein [Gammaproteobacteria bacterium]